MTQTITRHPIQVDRMPIVSGKIQLGGNLPQRFKEWFKQEFGTIHTLTINGQPWFMGTEIANILGYVKPNNALRSHVNSAHKKTLDISSTLYQGTVNQCKAPLTPIRVFISLSGLMRLITHSRLPKAEKFQDWIHDEILPSIYQTGAYLTNEKMSQIENNPQEMEKLLEELNQIKSENDQLKPLAQYTQTTLQSDEALTFTTVAKEFGMTAQQLHKFLEHHKVIYTRNKRKQTKVWQPHKKYANRGLFTFQTYTYSDNKQKVHSSTTLYITQKGRLEIHQIMLQHGIHPVVA